MKQPHTARLLATLVISQHRASFKDTSLAHSSRGGLKFEAGRKSGHPRESHSPKIMKPTHAMHLKHGNTCPARAPRSLSVHSASRRRLPTVARTASFRCPGASHAGPSQVPVSTRCSPKRRYLRTAGVVKERSGMGGGSRSTNRRKYNAFCSLANNPESPRMLKFVQTMGIISVQILVRMERRGFSTLLLQKKSTGAAHNASTLTKEAQFAQIPAEAA